MDITLYQCYQGLKAQTQSLEAISNNIANINTAGFKVESPFYSLIQQAIANRDGEEANYLVTSSFTDHQQGVLSASANPLDLALEGKGFFCVKTPTGLAYTRNGQFRLDSQSYLVTEDGNRVQSINGDILSDIHIEPGQVTVDKMGNILCDGVNAGVLKIVDFNDYSGLEKTGNSLFRPAAPWVKEVPTQNWAVQQGFRENSNASSVGMMVEMIHILRRFELLQKAMNTIVNDIDQKVIDQVGRPR